MVCFSSLWTGAIGPKQAMADPLVVVFPSVIAHCRAPIQMVVGHVVFSTRTLPFLLC